MPDPGPASSFEDRRSAAEQLIAAAAVEPQELGGLLGYELCALDGPRHVLADEPLVQAWVDATERMRSDLLQEAFGRLSERGMLLGPVRGTGPVDDQAVAPKLGLVLAARTRPGFALLAQHQDSAARTLKMFSIAQDDGPVPALVVEMPEPALKVSRRKSRLQRDLGPLGWIYRFLLVSPPFGCGSRAVRILDRTRSRRSNAVTPFWAEALVLRDLVDLSYGIIATLGLPAGTARSRCTTPNSGCGHGSVEVLMSPS